MMIQFTVDAIPVPQPRQRHAVVRGHVRNYTPKDHPVQAFKLAVQLAARQAYHSAPLTGALELWVVFAMPRPKSVKRSHPTGKPDLDNLVKGLLDALKGIAWGDDAQVCKMNLVKRYADESACVDVMIEEMD